MVRGAAGLWRLGRLQRRRNGKLSVALAQFATSWMTYTQHSEYSVSVPQTLANPILRVLPLGLVIIRSRDLFEDTGYVWILERKLL